MYGLVWLLYTIRRQCALALDYGTVELCPGVGEVGDGTWDLTDKLQDLCSLKTSSYSLHVLQDPVPNKFLHTSLCQWLQVVVGTGKGKVFRRLTSMRDDR
jgi:hypothetical protein